MHVYSHWTGADNPKDIKISCQQKIIYSFQHAAKLLTLFKMLLVQTNEIKNKGPGLATSSYTSIC